MKSIRQFLRQPLKTLIGIVMMTLGVLALCVGIGQIYTAKTTAETLEKSFDTVGIMAGMTIVQDCNFSSSSLVLDPGREAAQWVQETAQEHPDIVKQISQAGLASAYIRDLIPASYYEAEYWNHSIGYTALLGTQVRPENSPHSCAMLEITLEEIGEAQEQMMSFTVAPKREASEFGDYSEWREYIKNREMETVTSGYSVALRGKITNVLSLQNGIKDPTGMWLNFYYTAKTLEELEAFLAELELGSRYLVYGTNYYDVDWALRLQKGIDEWDFSHLRLLTKLEKRQWEEAGYVGVVAVYDGTWFYEDSYREINAVSMTVRSTPHSLINYEDIRDEAGNLLEIREVTEKVITDENGNSVTVSAEEFGEYYKNPSIVKLEGSAEEFLNSEAGAEWKAALERDAVNHHAFAVLGVDDLGYVAQFAREESQIVEGRDFTEEELESGERVCIISQQVAAASGLTVGDTIHPNFFNADENLPYNMLLTKNKGIINPSSAFYFSTTPMLGETEYTIVGIYRSNKPWAYVTASENHYAFTPNTIFVPKASITAEMQYSEFLQFQTVVLHNGRMDDFAALMNRAGYAGAYLLSDQGYSVIAGNFSDYEAQSKQVMQICVAAYAIISLLYLLLYPGSQRKTMRLMENLGVPGRQRRGHVFVSSVVLLIPAAVIGAVAGFTFWEKINDKLKLSAGLLVEVQLEGEVMVIVALAQLMALVTLSALIAAFQARPHKLGKGR